MDEQSERQQSQSRTRHSMEIGGRELHYEATAGYLPARDGDGTLIARLFFTSYVEADLGAASTRPLTFLFNGGPGSASLWLNIGGFGPKRAPTGTPTATPPAPYVHGDNPHTLLDQSDLVFIDAVGTGYSRFADGVDPARGWGVDADIDLFGKAIIEFLSSTGRWNSPRYLFGESYGTTRAAGLVHRLQNQGLDFNGVVLLSSVLNAFATQPGSDQHYVNLLPSYAATARYHGRSHREESTLEEFLESARAFATGEYASALQLGDTVESERLEAVAGEMSSFVGIPAQTLLGMRLRPEMEAFRVELLADSERKVGRFDARFTAENSYVVGSGSHDPATDDAATAGVNSAHLSAYRAHLSADLEFAPEFPYLPLNNMQLAPAWNWQHKAPGIDSPQALPNVSLDLAAAMRRNQSLRVLALGGIYDLATPFHSVEHDVSHLYLAPEVRTNLRFRFFEAGHMTFADERAVVDMRALLREFYDDSRS